MAQPGGSAQQGGQQQQPPPAPGGDGLPAEEEHGFPDQLDPEFPEEEEDLDQLDQAALLRLFVRNQQTQNRLIQMMSGGGKAKGKGGGAEWGLGVRGTVSDPESRVLVLFIGTTDLGHKNSLFGHKIFFLGHKIYFGAK